MTAKITREPIRLLVQLFRGLMPIISSDGQRTPTNVDAHAENIGSISYHSCRPQ